MPASARSTPASAHFGGFDHNAQALRIVTDLERRYADFDGLNLTWETLEGLVKHNGPLTDRAGRADRPLRRSAACRRRSSPTAKSRTSNCGRYASAEAQVAALADDIAYDAHDIDDGLRAELFTLDDIAAVPIDRRHRRARSTRAIRGLDAARRAHEIGAPLITRMIEDVIAETGAARSRRSSRARPPTCATRRSRWSAFRRRCRKPTPTSRAFSIRACTATRASMRVMDDAEARGARSVTRIIAAQPADLPAEWARGHRRARTRARRARRIADYIAGMTDRYALIEHARYFNATPELR